MRVFVENHTLCLMTRGKVYMIRPCTSIDGKFGAGQRVFRWFKLETYERGASIWSVFTVPYLLFGVARLRNG